MGFPNFFPVLRPGWDRPKFINQPREWVYHIWLFIIHPMPSTPVMAF